MGRPKDTSTVTSHQLGWGDIYYLFFYLFFIFKIFVYFGESTSEAGAERGGRGSKAVSELQPDSSKTDVGLELTNCEIMT